MSSINSNELYDIFKQRKYLAFFKDVDFTSNASDLTRNFLDNMLEITTRSTETVASTLSPLATVLDKDIYFSTPPMSGLAQSGSHHESSQFLFTKTNIAGHQRPSDYVFYPTTKTTSSQRLGNVHTNPFPRTKGHFSQQHTNDNDVLPGTIGQLSRTRTSRYNRWPAFAGTERSVADVRTGFGGKQRSKTHEKKYVALETDSDEESHEGGPSIAKYVRLKGPARYANKHRAVSDLEPYSSLPQQVPDSNWRSKPTPYLSRKTHATVERQVLEPRSLYSANQPLYETGPIYEEVL
jgi:hypothetical protein